MSDFTDALKKLSYAFLTKRCEVCGSVIELDDTVCENCKSLPEITGERCSSCGCSKQDCTCKKNKNEYKCIVAPYYYEESIVKAVHTFKDYDMPFLSKRFADDIAATVKDCYSDITFDYVTYVPLRKFKELKRGYNQSALIAQGAAEVIDVKCMPLLKKIRYTGVQHHKSENERRTGVYGAYDVPEKYRNMLEGKTILLIDDVKTTGSTLNECAKMLKIYGAAEVYAAALAVTKKNKK